VNGTKGIILSGRGPIWLYCYLTHYYHPTKFIATYDPRLNGAVIVESHTKDYKSGELIEVNINELLNC
jgi:CRISPR-associated protein Csx3